VYIGLQPDQQDRHICKKLGQQAVWFQYLLDTSTVQGTGLGEVRTVKEIGSSFCKDIYGAERWDSECQIGKMKGII
jgi:hypothetical protein